MLIIYKILLTKTINMAQTIKDNLYNVLFQEEYKKSLKLKIVINFIIIDMEDLSSLNQQITI